MFNVFDHWMSWFDFPGNTQEGAQYAVFAPICQLFSSVLVLIWPFRKVDFGLTAEAGKMPLEPTCWHKARLIKINKNS